MSESDTVTKTPISPAHRQLFEPTCDGLIGWLLAKWRAGSFQFPLWDFVECNTC